ncbi:hypothetical protein AJ87_06045 [Rhizobium yanglingense]|nr:hypothetical protein AJ87_06045 [Rhizobium yanglingense]
MALQPHAAASYAGWDTRERCAVPEESANRTQGAQPSAKAGFGYERICFDRSDFSRAAGSSWAYDGYR